MLPPSQIAAFIFSSISMVTYALIIISIHKRRRREPTLNGSFFRLCTINFFIDLAFFVQFNVFMRFRKYGLLNFFFEANPHLLVVLPGISLGIHYYIKFVAYISEVIIAANRLTAAIRPVSYEKIWSNSFIWKVRLLQFVLPLFLVIPLLVEPFCEIKYVIYEKQKKMRLIMDEETREVFAYLDMISALVATAVSFVMYLITIYKIRFLRSGRVLQNGRNSSHNFDYRLLESAFIMFLVFTPNALVCVLTILFNNDLNIVLIVNDFSYPVVDLMYCCPPWALLLTSSKIRQFLWRTTGKKITRVTSPKPEVSVLAKRTSLQRF
ncbi:hypothetical protein Y032_0370g97 [Ancylostoma ceylanicum]|uniref:Serpentine receptor class gamma n=1 Tax=Ancylostoma ceylanicum TaxID=53326 RepID=A0A016RUK9_9BILA|nr:hypothetical protein Y032_0370g97 [Ancylostoma ceylanicum]